MSAGASSAAAKASLAGIALMVLAMQVVPVNDALAKLLSQSLPVLMVVFLRTCAQSFFLALIIGVRMRLPGLKSVVGRRHVLRGFLWWISTALFFYAIRDHDIPGALALFFTGPLFVAATAPLVLKERFDVRFLGATLLCFVGALFILRPEAGSFQLGMLPALLAGMCYGSYLMATRHVALDRELAAGEIAFGAGFWASVIGLPFALYFWEPPAAQLWPVIIAMGACSSLGHVFIALACQRANASALAPYTYTEMAGAIVASYLIFDHLPAAGAWFGIAVIVASGVAVAVVTYQRPVDAIV